MGFKVKMLFLMLVYFAGFSTAIYLFGPALDAQTIAAIEGDCDGKAAVATGYFSPEKSEKFARAFNVCLHKCVYYGKIAVVKAGQLAKQKYQEYKDEHKKQSAKTD